MNSTIFWKLSPKALAVALIAFILGCQTSRHVSVAEASPDAAPRLSELRKTDETNNPRRVISISADDFDAVRALHPIPEDARVIGYADSSRQSIRVATFEVQRGWIEEAGIEILGVSEDTPRRWFDPHFMQRMGQPVEVDEHGEPVYNACYKDSAMIEGLLRACHEAHPDITRLVEIGRSWQGRPIFALLISDNPDVDEDEPAHLFDGAHHGSELLSIEPVFDVIEYLTTRYDSDPRVRAWVDGNEIWCVPVVNPDGLDRHWHLADRTGRSNARDVNGDGTVPPGEGVDLNRNYPFLWASGAKGASSGNPTSSYYRGHVPASEPETQAMIRLAYAQRFVTSVSYHTSATALLVPYTIDKADNPSPSVAWEIGRDVISQMDSHRSRPYRLRRHLYSVDGTDQDWHMFANGTQAFLLELPRHNPDYLTHRDSVVEGARPLWMAMLDRLPQGPSLSGHVVDDATGEALEAFVSLDEVHWLLGERHTSHPQTGRFDRLLPSAGTYHVRVECEGYNTMICEVPVAEGQWRQVEIRMHRAGL